MPTTYKAGNYLEWVEINNVAPAAVGTSENITGPAVEEGDTILAAYGIAEVLAGATTTSTVSLGDDGSVARFIAARDTETGAIGDIFGGAAANFPYTYTADDTIDVDYIAGATPGTTNPRWSFFVLIARRVHGRLA